MVATYASAALLFSLALYVTVSVLGKRDNLTLRTFFGESGRPWMAVVSLTAYNVTLGTGIAYVLSQAQATGYLVFLTPIAVTLGYLAVGSYRGRVKYVSSPTSPNIFYLLSRCTLSGAPEPIPFARAFSAFIGATYFLLFAFELSVGSSFISHSLLKSPETALTVAIATLILVVVVGYTAISGLRAAVTTDVAQLVFILAFIIAIPYIVSQGGVATPALDVKASTAANQTTFTTAQAVSAALAILTAISTQFYSLVNSQLISSYQPETQRRVLFCAGLASGAIYAVVAAIGLVITSRESLEAAIRTFLYSATPGPYDGLIAFLLFAGMLAVLMSTLDNVAIAVAQQFYDLAEGRRRRKGQAALTPDAELKRFRYFYVVIGILVAPVAAFLYSRLPNAFYMLLTILFAAGTLSPIVFTAILLRAEQKTTLVELKSVASSIGVAVLAGWGGYIYLMNIGKSFEGSVLHIVAFVAAGIFAAYDYRSSRKSPG
jgi:Na+/proline symporter